MTLVENNNTWNNKKKQIAILITIATIIISIFYFKIFFTRGIYFEDAFLKKEVIGSEYHYKGNNGYGNMDVIVIGEAKTGSEVNVIFNLPNNIHKEFTVLFNETSYYNSDVTIKENDNIVFDGQYTRGSRYLESRDGGIYPEDSIVRIKYTNESPFNAQYKVPLIRVVGFSLRTDEQKRGITELLLMAFFLFGVTIFDYTHPLFLFMLRHVFEVNEPEPTDFYISKQKFLWYLLPIIGSILMLLAIFPRILDIL